MKTATRSVALALVSVRARAGCIRVEMNVTLQEDDTDARVAITAPPAEAYALLMEAASRIGSVGYVDRHLGILEVVVRFEGGPTCSVLCTLRGRPFHTEVGCAMESIEAAPTPPIGPVVEALVEELRHPGGRAPSPT